MMVLSRWRRPFPIWGVVVLCLLSAVWATADSLWLYGVHWYGDPASNDLETMTGGKGIWVLETMLTEDAGQWGLAPPS